MVVFVYWEPVINHHLVLITLEEEIDFEETTGRIAWETGINVEDCSDSFWPLSESGTCSKEPTVSKLPLVDTGWFDAFAAPQTWLRVSQFRRPLPTSDLGVSVLHFLITLFVKKRLLRSRKVSINLRIRRPNTRDIVEMVVIQSLNGIGALSIRHPQFVELFRERNSFISPAPLRNPIFLNIYLLLRKILSPGCDVFSERGGKNSTSQKHKNSK